MNLVMSSYVFVLLILISNVSYAGSETGELQNNLTCVTKVTVTPGTMDGFNGIMFIYTPFRTDVSLDCSEQATLKSTGSIEAQIEAIKQQRKKATVRDSSPIRLSTQPGNKNTK